MDITAAIRNCFRRTILVVLLLVLSAGGCLWTQQPALLELVPNPVGVNDRFTLSFIVDTPFANDVSVGNWEFPEGVRLYAGPYIRGIITPENDGTTRPAVSVSYILRSSRTGLVLLPAIPYSDGRSTRYTEERVLRVGTYRNGELTIPLELEWEIPAGPFYEGQTIPAVLLLQNQEEILLPDRVVVPASKGGFFEEAPELGSIRSRSYGNTVLYSVPVTGYLFTPTGAGRFFLNRAEISAEGVEGSSPSRAIEVEPLPDAASVSGAVGRFRLISTLNRPEIRLGEEAELRIRIEGEGNLSYLTLPVPENTGLSLLESDDIHAYLPSQAGYIGYRELVFLVQAEEEGRYTLTVPAFPQFDPATGRLDTGEARILELAVGPGGVLDDEEPRYRPEALLYTADELAETQGAGATGKWQLYLILIPAPLILIVTRLRRRILFIVPLLFFLLTAAGLGFMEDAGEANRLFLSGQYDQAAQSYGSLLAAIPQNGRLFYNYSLALEASGDRSRAVLALVSAHRHTGAEDRLRVSWEELSRRGDYVRQYDLPRYFPPDLAFVLLLVFYNLFFLILTIASLRPSSLFLLGALLFGTLSLGAGGLLAHGWLVRREPIAVVAEDLVTRRIPRESAQEWIELPEGLAVTLTQASGEFRLVETAYGVEGWVYADQLLYPNSGEDERLP